MFKRFLKSGDTVWICQANELLFRSSEKGLIPLLTYLEKCTLTPVGVTSYDRIVGNAAALLLRQASCTQVYGVIGSQLAAQTLKELGISYSFLTTVPHILNRSGNDMCPFEKASIGKSPEEFYELVKEKIRAEGACLKG
ncbi:MAG: DUF1893 domain-containing protein [Dehalococcoidales bacterium]